MSFLDKVKKSVEVTWNSLKKVASVVSGHKAYTDRKESKRMKAEADVLYELTQQENERRIEEVNDVLCAFGKVRLEILSSTVGTFLRYLEKMKHNYLEKEYNLSAQIGIPEEEVKKMESVEMGASQLLGTTTAAVAGATAAISGVPGGVTFAVSTLASASTGTAISSLSGAAANNAVLAWLGGGSLAAGGGGMAAGSVVLAGITYTAAGIVALASIGIITSMVYSKKRTAVEKYFADVREFRAKSELAWSLIDAIIQRATEMENVTLALRDRIVEQLNYLEPLIYDFQANDSYFIDTFQTTAMMVKGMSELAQVPILDQKGEVSEQSQIEINKIQKILNKDLLYES